MNSVRGVAIAVAVTFGIGLLLSFVVSVDRIADVDRDLTRSFHDVALESGAVSDFALGVTALGNPVTLTAFVVIAGAWLVLQGRRRIAAWLVIATVGGSLVSSLLKVVVGRSRPDFESVFLEPVSKSFPSGHALNTTVVLGSITIALVVSATSRHSVAVPAGATAAVLVALAVGLSRPVLGVHFVSDVLAGWALGVLWLVLLRPRAWEPRDVRSRPGSISA